MLIRTVRLSLPPTTNHAYKIAARWSAKKGRLCAVMVKTPALIAWEKGADKVVGRLDLPPRTPLMVTIRLELTRQDLRRHDLDGYIKPLLDATVGRLRDQWIDGLVVNKCLGDGWATVRISTMEGEV